MEIDNNLADSLRDRWIEAKKYLGQSLPLILHAEVYEYFGERCRIVEANVFNDVADAEVVIENSSGNRTQIEFNQLSWGRNMTLINALSEKPITEIIVKGP